MEQTKLVPKRRFKEFQNTSAWEQRRLGDVAEITMGQSPNSDNYTDNPNDHILVQGNADIKNGYVTPRVWTTQVTKQAEKGDLILSVRAPVGDIGKTDYDVVLGRGVAAIKGNEFIFQSLGRMKQTGYWNKLSTGSTFESINSNDIKDASIMIPGAEEQVKIGSFFKRLDSLITLHQRKLEKTKALKTAYLSEMFPAEGERVPKRRFAGFTQPWEQRAFSELVTRVTKSSEVDELPRVEYEDIISGQGELNKDIFAKEREKKGIEFTTGDTLFGKLRPYLQNWLFADFKGIAVGDWWVLRPNEMDSKFIYYLIQSDKYQTVANLSTGTKMPRSDWNVVSKTEFFVPVNREEQANIGNFFKQLDNLITLHQRKLEKLQNLKKAYLNEMFV